MTLRQRYTPPRYCACCHSGSQDSGEKSQVRFSGCQLCWFADAAVSLRALLFLAEVCLRAADDVLTLASRAESAGVCGLWSCHRGAALLLLASALPLVLRFCEMRPGGRKGCSLDSVGFAHTIVYQEAVIAAPTHVDACFPISFYMVAGVSDLV